jgi:two-component system response regulator DctR
MIFTSEPSSNEINNSYLKEAAGTNQKSTFRANSKRRVLAVDDNASMRAFLYDALSMLDYNVVTEGSGTEGFERFIQKYFDLVITDCQMPSMDGWQLAELIKKVSNHTPIILVTGQNKDQVMDKMQCGYIDLILFKPFELDDFYKTVRASLEIKNLRCHPSRL